MAKGLKQPKPKTCKQCKEKFTPDRPLQFVCSPSCAYQYQQRQKQKRQQETDAEARRDWNKRKSALKPLKHWEHMTQRALNDYITKGRDADKPCISCGTWETVQWEAGHYRSRGAASHLRYNEDNLAKQCHRCNCELSGNAIHYREGLIARIGIKRVLALESNNEPHRYTRDELDAIRARYIKALRELNKQREAA